MNNVFAVGRARLCRFGVGLMALLLLMLAGAGPLSAAPSVVDTVSVGTRPIRVAVSPTTGLVYVTNIDGNTVSVIDSATNAVTDTITVGNAPLGIAVNAAGTLIYVANRNSGTVSVIDSATNAVTATIPGFVSPSGLAVNAAGTRIYVTSPGNATVKVVDTATNAVTATIAGFNSPRSVAVNGDGTRIYVANFNTTTVSVIDGDTNAVINTITGLANPVSLAVNATGTRIYVTNLTANTVKVVDTATNAVTATIGVGNSPTDIAVNSDGTRIYVTNQNDDTVSVIDGVTNTVTETITVGNFPQGVALNGDGTRIYVTNLSDNTVSVLADTPPASPVFTVTNNSDAATNGICDAAGTGDGCSLREAISAATAFGSQSTVEFDPALAGNTVSLSIVGDNVVGPTALTISTPITINGLAGSTTESGITIARNASLSNLRLFRVSGAGNLTLRNLTLSGGAAIGGNGGSGQSGGGGGAGLGGAIIVGDGGAAGGVLTVENCTLSGNNATGGNGGLGDQAGGGGGGGGNSGGSGGNNGGTGSPGNVGGFGSGGGGGGFGSSNGGNGGGGGFGGGGGGGGNVDGNGSGGGFGGGKGGDFGGFVNVGGGGGGGGGGGLGSAILNYGGTVSLSNSTFSGNTAIGGSGGGGSNAGNNGAGFGAVFNGYGTLSVGNCTFSGNQADDGAAIFNNGDGMGNAATLVLNNSILANSVNGSSSATSDYDDQESDGTQTSSGSFNIIETNNGFGGTGTVTDDPALGALADNGGPTQTFAITNTSPAYNAGDLEFDGTDQTDQRGAGFARVSDGKIDIGAFELQVVPNTAPVIGGVDGTTTTYKAGGPAILLAGSGTVADADSTDFNGGQLFVNQINGANADVISIRNQGTEAGQIGLEGDAVLFGGTLIGTFANGNGGQDLTVSLSANATPEATQALLRAITFLPAASLAEDRNFRITLSDGDGGTSDNAATTVTIVPNTAPVATDVTLSGRVNKAFSGSLAATDADDGDTLTYAIVAPDTLPNGLILNATTGAITGTPTVISTSTITFTATDNKGAASNEATATINVIEPGVLVVNTTTDSTPYDSLTSLREAIAFANENADMSTVEFDRTVFATKKTIVLNVETTLSQPISIIGPAAGVVIDGVNSSKRLFIVNSGISASFDGLTITHGAVGIFNSGTTKITNCTLRDNDSNTYNTQGTTTLTNCTSSDGSDKFRSGINNSVGTTNLINCTLVTGEGYILVNPGRGNNVNLTNCTLSGNGNNGIVNNGTANVNNTIVVGNGVGFSDPSRVGTLSGSNNITGGTADAAGLQTSDGMDAVVLKDNGGRVQTIALVKNGAAVDEGSNDLLPADTTDMDGDENTTEPIPFDGRGAGFARIKVGTVDIGAFESPDFNAPTISITTPADKAIVNTLTPISGTASDNVAVVRVDLYLQRQIDKKFWNGGSWADFSSASTLSTVLTTTQTGVNWTRSSGLPTGPDLLSGPYFIAARAVDAAGNGTSTSAIVNVDVLAPIVAISSPVVNAAIATSPVINGFASDTQGGSGLDRVTLVLRRNGVGDYWNGTNWAGNTPVAFNATLTGTSWKRDGGLPVIATADPTKKLTDGGYTVTAVAYDRAGNLSPFISANFTVDTKKPVVAITSPANNANVSTLPSVSGTTSDIANGSGVATVALYLQRKSDNKYWNGTSWVAPVSALTTTLSGTTWTRNSGLPSGADLSIGNYFLAARATDRAGNGESATSNFRVVAGSSVAQASPSTVALSSASAKTDGTIRLSFTGALGASAGDANSYAVNNGETAIATVSQPDASTVEIKASALASGARIAVAYDVQDAQGRSLKGSANVTVK